MSVPFTQRLTARLGAASGPPERRAWSAIETGGRLRSLTDEEDRQLDQTGALLSRLPPGSRLVTVLLRTSNGASYWVINLYERLGRPT